MANKLMYVPNYDQNYPDRRLQLLVVTFGHLMNEQSDWNVWTLNQLKFNKSTQSSKVNE